MKRPLCLLCLAFVVVLIICRRLMPVSLPDHSKWDGQELILEGEVYRKEHKEKPGTGSIPVLYLKEVHLFNESDDLCDNDRVDSSVNSYKISNFQKTDPVKQSYGQIQNIICDMEKGGFEPVIGSRIRVKGKVRCFAGAGNPGEFDMQKYYSIMKIDFRLENAVVVATDKKEKTVRERLYCLRRYFSGVLEAVYDKKEASVMRAMLLGEKEGLDETTKGLYQRSSIIHILSISGLHISMIGMSLYKLLRRMGMPIKPGAMLSVGVITGYGLMTGMSMSATRAILMFSIHLAAEMAGRTYDMLTALSVAAVLLLLQQPEYIMHSGFLFSFGAVASMGVLLPVWEKEISKEKIKICKKLKDAFLPGFAVFLGTLPIHLVFYYQFPIYMVLLNVIVISLMTVLMGTGLFTMLAGGVCRKAVKGTVYIGQGILCFYEWCCSLLERLPGGIYVSGIPENWQILSYYSLLAVFAVFGKKLKKAGRYVCLLGAFGVLLFRFDTEVQITVLDVGQGDCIHIRSAGGKHYLIDGGSATKSGVEKYQMLPYLKSQGASRLEAVFVTHSDSDHCNGIIDLLKEENGPVVKNLILPDIAPESRDTQYREMELLAEKRGIRTGYMGAGQVVREGSLRITCMHPAAGYTASETNEHSLVLLLEYGSFSGLFTGDAEGEGEREAWHLTEKYLHENGKKGLTFLKVAHHGSKYSTGEEQLLALPPKMAVISCGKRNRYGHPHEELLERMERTGSRIYITAQSGAVTIKTDGKRVWISTFK